MLDKLDTRDTAEQRLARIPKAVVGGMEIAAIGRADTAALMLDLAHTRRRGSRPLFFTSANGEVLARVARDPALADLFAVADQVVADGQPMVIASRLRCRNPLPERVATTDLFHDAARLAEEDGSTFYMLGASPEEIRRAAATVRAMYPRLRLVGHSHGYLEGLPLAIVLDEIDALAPDILWLGLGVPREQAFVAEHGSRLRNVGVIKTSGGLFNFLSGKNRRAPAWMQAIGAEWLWRLMLEPRRLFWRYFVTNPLALFLVLTKSR
jgi:exopolysaccharide biosynthesis WecB/TagA/CpsF family protein